MNPHRDPIQISWAELNDPRVDEKLREAESLAAQAPDFEQSVPTISEPHLLESVPTHFWYNTIVFMTLFGLLGGLLGWSGGEILHFRPDARSQAREWMAARHEVEQARDVGALRAEAAERSLREIDRAAAGNPYYRILKDPSLDEAQRDEQLRVVAGSESWRRWIANTLFYSISGMLIAVCLAIAEPLVDRNTQAAVLNGSIGAILGLVGGVLASLVVDPLFHFLQADAATDATRRLVARSLTWGVLGVFLSVAPGLVLRNRRKLLAGLGGGLVGGLVGGALYELVARGLGNEHLSRLVAISAVGAVAGLGTGWIENAAKSGWLRVVGGLIAGKQFILYRNPTYIGSSLQCAIYLFKDPRVGRRHAAIHLVRGGFELEDLPLGGPTYINGRPIARQRLRNNDRIQIGGTTFQFQEKEKSAAQVS